MLACAATALVLAIGVVAFMGGHAYGLVLLRRLALGLAAAGALGLIAWTQGDMRAVGPALALSCGLGAWLVLDSSAFYVTPATGWRGGRWTGARAAGADRAGGTGRGRYLAVLDQPLDSSTAWRQRCMRAARTDSGQAGWKVRSACRGELVLAGPEAHGKARPAAPARSIPIRAGAPRHAQQVGLHLHEQVVARRAAVHAQLGQGDAAVAVHAGQQLGALQRDGFQRGAGDVARVVPRVSPTRVPRA